MAKRENHYEVAFEEYLRAKRVPYMAVDEARRSLAADGSLKNLDFIISTRRWEHWLVDVKGRQFSAPRYWKNWSTRDDLDSLERWESVFGQQFQGLFVFAYGVVGDRAPLPLPQLWPCRGRLYGFVAIRRDDYARHARQLSPRWGTVGLASKAFRELAAPLETFL